jgi:hypothetical protein
MFLARLPFLHSLPPGVKWINYFSCLVFYSFMTLCHYFLPSFRLPLRCQSDLRSYGMLRTVDWLLVTEVSEQPLGLFFCLTLQNVADKLYRNVGNYQSALLNLLEDRRSNYLLLIFYFVFSVQCFLLKPLFPFNVTSYSSRRS